MEEPVPSVFSIDVIYPQDAIPAQQERWTNLLNSFQQHYAKPAEFVARSPGRVNIIGEHIDYSLYEVLPMAITADVIIAVSTYTSHSKPGPGHGASITIANVNSSKFPPSTFRISPTGREDRSRLIHPARVDSNSTLRYNSKFNELLFRKFGLIVGFKNGESTGTNKCSTAG